MISTSAELARARQREVEVFANRPDRRHVLYTFRQNDGAMRVLSLRRHRRQP